MREKRRGRAAFATTGTSFVSTGGKLVVSGAVEFRLRKTHFSFSVRILFFRLRGVRGGVNSLVSDSVSPARNVFPGWVQNDQNPRWVWQSADCQVAGRYTACKSLVADNSPIELMLQHKVLSANHRRLGVYKQSSDRRLAHLPIARPSIPAGKAAKPGSIISETNLAETFCPRLRPGQQV